MLSDRGAAARLSPADLPPLDGVDHLHLSGYVLLDPSSRPAGLAALAAARAAGASTSVDPQADRRAVPGVLLAWLRGVDLLLPNADELAALTGSTRCRRSAGGVARHVGARRGRHGGAERGELGGPGRCPRCPRGRVAVADGRRRDGRRRRVRRRAARGVAARARARRRRCAAGCAAGAEAVSRRGGRPAAPGVTSRSSRTSPSITGAVERRVRARLEHLVRPRLERLPVSLVAVDLLALARQPVVRDEHGHPGQRDRDDQQRDRQPRSLVEDRGQHHARHPHAHHQGVPALAYSPAPPRTTAPRR